MDISTEPMEVDLSLSSIKSMEVSYCATEEPEERIIMSSTPRCEPKNFLQSLIKQEPLTEDLSPVTGIEDGPNGNQNYKKIDVDKGLYPAVGQQKDYKKNMTRTKKYHIKKQNTRKSPNFVLKLSVVLVLSVSIVIYHVNTFRCSEELDIPVIKETLDSKLYGQQRAIDSLIRSLNAKVSSKIIFLYGGTGVGKTYATSLILEQAWNSSNVYHYTMPTFLDVFPNNLLLGMSICRTSVLIVDDLTRYDTSIMEHIERVIEKNEYLEKNITIILIYNSDVIDNGFTKSSDTAFFEFDLKDSFSHVKAYKEYIKFETLTEEHLKMCIKTELEHANVASINQIIQNFNVTLDGCKGVHSKMKFLNVT